MSKLEVATTLKGIWTGIVNGWPGHADGFELWKRGGGIDGYIEKTFGDIERARALTYVVAIFPRSGAPDDYDHDVDVMINGAVGLTIKLVDVFSMAAESVIFVPHIGMLKVLELYREMFSPNVLVESVCYVGHGNHVIEDVYKEQIVENATSMLKGPTREQALKVIAVVCFGAHADMELRDRFPLNVRFFGCNKQTNTDVCKNDEWVHHSLSPSSDLTWTDEWGATWTWFSKGW